MDGYLTLKKAIPPGLADAVAYYMGVTGDAVRKWCREPIKKKHAQPGRRNPLDRICDLLTAVHKVDKPHARLILQHINDHFEDLEAEADESRRPLSQHELEEQLQRVELELAKAKSELRARRRENDQSARRR
jgi:hypothetical protein